MANIFQYEIMKNGSNIGNMRGLGANKGGKSSLGTTGQSNHAAGRRDAE